MEIMIGRPMGYLKCNCENINNSGDVTRKGNRNEKRNSKIYLHDTGCESGMTGWGAFRTNPTKHWEIIFVMKNQ